MFRALLALPLMALPATAQPRLELPIDCVPGESCFIQNYVDRDTGPGARDYTCQGLSYDGHKGTDFGLPSLARMLEGVEVRAAAPGTVKGVRNDMIDKLYTEAEDARIDGRDCGNGVVIDHGEGWETQYCHMRQHSVRVRSGDQVKAGAPLGLVGLSGRSQFPHLHISVRHNGQPVDPFTPDARIGTCGGTWPTLWSDDLAYAPGGMMSVGFADRVPSYADIKAGTAAVPVLHQDAGAIVLWGFAFGGREGDEIEIAITGPDGPVVQGRQALDKPQAQFFRANGKRLRAPLAKGKYQGTVTFWRGDDRIDSRTITLRVD